MEEESSRLFMPAVVCYSSTYIHRYVWYVACENQQKKLLVRVDFETLIAGGLDPSVSPHVHHTFIGTTYIRCCAKKEGVGWIEFIRSAARCVCRLCKSIAFQSDDGVDQCRFE